MLILLATYASVETFPARGLLVQYVFVVVGIATHALTIVTDFGLLLCQNNAPLYRKCAIFLWLVLFPFIVLWNTFGLVSIILQWDKVFDSDYPSTRAAFTFYFVVFYLFYITFAMVMSIAYKRGEFESFFLTSYTERVFAQSTEESSGLAKEAINRLPLYTLSQEEALMHSYCSICLDSLEAGELVRQLQPCGHLFHKNHIDEWISRKDTCPLCRSQVYLCDSEAGSIEMEQMA